MTQTTNLMLNEGRLTTRLSPTNPGPAQAEGAVRPISRLLFDRRDTELIDIINTVINQDKDLSYARKRYYGYFHPHGIKEMAESRSLRIAYAMVHLLTSLELGRMDERLSALRSLKDEVLDRS
jgi:hypothetical protein